MILQALVDYYDRKISDPDSDVAPAGFEQKEIPFLLVIDAFGQLVQIEDTRSGDGKKKRASTFSVPQGAKKTSGIAANLLWDNAEYVLGIDTRGKPERVAEQHQAYRTRLAELPESDEGMKAVRSFLGRIPWEQLAESPLWEEIRTTNPLLTFKLITDIAPICQRSSIRQHLQQPKEGQDHSFGYCLLSGEQTAIERLHPSIKGVWGAQTSGANIVSFNQRSFESYGKEQRQGENAPIGKQAVFAYTTALNHLLGKDSRQRMQIGDASAVFWAEKKDCVLENDFNAFWSDPPKDDPDRLVSAVKALYQSLRHGSLAADSETTRFFVLGLAPNAARIAIRFWHQGSVRDLSEHIAQHFHDLEIDHAPHEQPHLPLFRLLLSIAGQGKADNIPPNLAGETMRAVLDGLPYPTTLLQAAIRRIRAEQNIPYARAALIKACINRQCRSQNLTSSARQEKLNVSLDHNNTHAGYRLGRLFAVLERIQERSSGGDLNTTIRDRFYGAASSTPVTVFPNLMKLSKHHLAKIENKGELVNFEKNIGEILDGIDEFPSLLRIDDQGRFAIGYYHQKQSFYKKSEPGENA